ncbi:MAG: peptidoglycan DD-metalloendopeptidase family protein [Gammaproteobacteria bacterium]|nr:peptidoglycan DD-metalloendopeptidase family protein [Gammaproteobacteria bacterium]
MCVRARLVIAIIISCILAACSTEPDRPVYYQYEKKYHTVLKGDTLYSIAYQHGLDYQELAAWNKIGKPYTIFPGQKILLKLSAPSKDRGLNSATRKRTEVPAAAAATNRQPIKQQTKDSIKPSTAAKQAQHGWTWPTRGKVIRKFSVKGRGNKGIDISGKVGQAVLAASSGKVVYSGSGLPGYGNLIIVKHSEQFLSAYAHNSRLLVKEGKVVTRGQKIAELGSTGTNSPRLHFEIRKFGKPVDPLRYLPKE